MQVVAVPQALSVQVNPVRVHWPAANVLAVEKLAATIAAPAPEAVIEASIAVVALHMAASARS